MIEPFLRLFQFSGHTLQFPQQFRILLRQSFLFFLSLASPHHPPWSGVVSSICTKQAGLPRIPQLFAVPSLPGNTEGPRLLPSAPACILPKAWGVCNSVLVPVQTPLSSSEAHPAGWARPAPRWFSSSSSHNQNSILLPPGATPH